MSDLYLAGLRGKFRPSVLKSPRRCVLRPWQGEAAVESDRPSRKARKPLGDGHNHQLARNTQPYRTALPIVAVQSPCHLLGLDMDGRRGGNPWQTKCLAKRCAMGRPSTSRKGAREHLLSVQLRVGVNERNYVAPTWPGTGTVTQTHSFRLTTSIPSHLPRDAFLTVHHTPSKTPR